MHWKSETKNVRSDRFHRHAIFSRSRGISGSFWRGGGGGSKKMKMFLFLKKGQVNGTRA